jgi:hypothetical protein
MIEIQIYLSYFSIYFEIAYFQLRTNNEFLKRLIDKI